LNLRNLQADLGSLLTDHIRLPYLLRRWAEWDVSTLI